MGEAIFFQDTISSLLSDKNIPLIKPVGRIHFLGL